MDTVTPGEENWVQLLVVNLFFSALEITLNVFVWLAGTLFTNFVKAILGLP